MKYAEKVKFEKTKWFIIYQRDTNTLMEATLKTEIAQRFQTDIRIFIEIRNIRFDVSLYRLKGEYPLKKIRYEHSILFYEDAYAIAKKWIEEVENSWELKLML